MNKQFPEVSEFLYRVANPSREDMAEFQRIYLQPLIDEMAAGIDSAWDSLSVKSPERQS